MPPNFRCLRRFAGAAVPGLGGCVVSVPPDDAALRSLTLALRSRPIVLLGEVHDNTVQHALRARALRALRALVESGARPVLMMEQFDRERQADLDRAMAQPGAMADGVIAAATPADASIQGWSWPLYRPYVALALEYRLPLVAANVSRADTRRIASDGLAAHGFQARMPDDLAAGQARAIVEGHCGLIDTAQAGGLVAAQVACDQFMARVVEAHAVRGAVLLAGNGHVRTHRPRRAALAGPRHAGAERVDRPARSRPRNRCVALRHGGRDTGPAAARSVQRADDAPGRRLSGALIRRTAQFPSPHTAASSRRPDRRSDR